MVPEELSVKLTTRGQVPLVGLAVKSAPGIIAPTPVTGLVALPALPVVTITVLLKLPTLVGENSMTRLVEPKPGTSKFRLDRMAKGPALSDRDAVELMIGAPPL